MASSLPAHLRTRVILYGMREGRGGRREGEGEEEGEGKEKGEGGGKRERGREKGKEGEGEVKGWLMLTRCLVESRAGSR